VESEDFSPEDVRDVEYLLVAEPLVEVVEASEDVDDAGE